MQQLTENEIIRALNEWQRRYIANPREFEAEFETIEQFKADENEGKTPDYGTVGAAYMFKIIRDDHVVDHRSPTTLQAPRE